MVLGGTFFANKKIILTQQMFLFWVKLTLIRQISSLIFFKILKSPDFYNKFLPRAPSLHQAVKISKDLYIHIYIYMYVYLVYSQIWLNLLVDDCQCGWLQILHQKTEKNKFWSKFH
jgi:hypothetical protein